MRDLIGFAVIALVGILLFLILVVTFGSQADLVGVTNVTDTAPPVAMHAASMPPAPPSTAGVPAVVTATARTAPTSTTTTLAPSSTTGVSDATWDRVAACESGQRWNDTRGGYEGGVHFMHATWVRAGGRRFAEHAYQATRAQQIAIANAWLRLTDWRQWPTCSRKLGLR